MEMIGKIHARTQGVLVSRVTHELVEVENAVGLMLQAYPVIDQLTAELMAENNNEHLSSA